MAGTQTAGFDIVLEVNARIFESIAEARLRPQLGFGIIPLDGGLGGDLITSTDFRLSFFFAGATGDDFLAELILMNARLVPGDGGTPVPLGPQTRVQIQANLATNRTAPTNVDMVLRLQLGAGQVQFRPDD